MICFSYLNVSHIVILKIKIKNNYSTTELQEREWYLEWSYLRVAEGRGKILELDRTVPRALRPLLEWILDGDG
jgi:hypothetical protein